MIKNIKNNMLIENAIPNLIILPLDKKYMLKYFVQIKIN